jgi:alkanesulfonate monooxygenase SsuD/methylene tetrahydromethanopterin reductase-like flavin-dependent oxidoreductase (luciferase family)
MSGGRVELGIGAGWFAAEHRAYGVPFPDVGERFDRFAEQVEIIDGLRRTPAGETYDFDGTYYQLSDVPFDRPGTGAAFERVRAAAAQAGRELIYSAAQVLCVGRDEAELKRRAAAIDRDVDDLRETGLAGSPAEVVERIGEFAELGAARLYLQVLDLADLDHLELVSSEVAPQL